jgi:hypothetical protein
MPITVSHQPSPYVVGQAGIATGYGELQRYIDEQNRISARQQAELLAAQQRQAEQIRAEQQIQAQRIAAEKASQQSQYEYNLRLNDQRSKTDWERILYETQRDRENAKTQNDWRMDAAKTTHGWDVESDAWKYREQDERDRNARMDYGYSPMQQKALDSIEQKREILRQNLVGGLLTKEQYDYALDSLNKEKSTIGEPGYYPKIRQESTIEERPDLGALVIHNPDGSLNIHNMQRTGGSGQSGGSGRDYESESAAKQNEAMLRHARELANIRIGNGPDAQPMFPSYEAALEQARRDFGMPQSPSPSRQFAGQQASVNDVPSAFENASTGSLPNPDTWRSPAPSPVASMDDPRLTDEQIFDRVGSRSAEQRSAPEIKPPSVAAMEVPSGQVVETVNTATELAMAAKEALESGDMQAYQYYRQKYIELRRGVSGVATNAK